tara:strand:- start:267 stop:428 length:162 start_codon:yes stop_codon:yes gene_type:complete
MKVTLLKESPVKFKFSNKAHNKSFAAPEICDPCHGSGMQKETSCSSCNGKGIL